MIIYTCGLCGQTFSGLELLNGKSLEAHFAFQCKNDLPLGIFETLRALQHYARELAEMYKFHFVLTAEKK